MQTGRRYDSLLDHQNIRMLICQSTHQALRHSRRKCRFPAGVTDELDAFFSGKPMNVQANINIEWWVML